MMKKLWFWVLVVVITTAVSVIGTIAFLDDVEKDVNVVTIGNVVIDQLEYERVDPATNGDSAVVQRYKNDHPLFPAVVDPGYDWNAKNGKINWEQIGNQAFSSIWDPNTIENELDKVIIVRNKGNLPAYVRTVYAFEGGNLDWAAFRQQLRLNIDEVAWTWEWIETPVTIGDGNYFLAIATHNQPLKAGKFSEPSLSQVALDSEAGNETVMSFGDSYIILTKTQAMQADGFSDPKAALEDGFGVITAENHPFKETSLPTYVYNEEDLKRAAERGGLAILMNDIEVTSRTYFNKPGCVLDMSGHTIFNGNPEIARTAFAIRVDSGGSLTIKGNGKFVDNHTDKDGYYSPGIFCVSGAGSVLTVEGGYFDAGNHDNGNMLVQAQSNGTFVIHGGTFENNGSEDAGDFLYAMSGATIEIHDGFFRNDGSYEHTINVHNDRPGKVIVKGGTFVNHWPGKTTDPGYVKVAEGYTVISEVQPNGETWYTVVPVDG